MKHDETIALPGTGKITRRRIIRVLALVGVCMAASLLISCKPSTGETGGVNLSLLEWSGYENPKYYPEYVARYGGEPEFTFFAQADAAMKRMRTGYRVDVVHLCTGQMAEARAAGLIKPIEIDRIPRWRDIPPSLLDLPDVRIDGEYMLVPWEWGYSTVGYNPEVIEVENPTYDIFVDPRFKGKTALPSDIGVNLIIAGIIGHWADPLDPTDAEMEAAPEIFTKMLENARFVWTDSTQLEQAWAAGDVGISYIYGSASRRMPKEGMPMVVVEPLQTWMCGLSISANGAGSEDQAYDYINAMLDPRSGVALFDQYGYGHGNANSVDLIEPEKVIGTGIDDPVGTFARGVFTSALPPAKKARLFQLWFEAQAGLD
ncbi:MAG: extracellular solute-binding protein [Xanthomonadales bacterium]